MSLEGKATEVAHDAGEVVSHAVKVTSHLRDHYLVQVRQHYWEDLRLSVAAYQLALDERIEALKQGIANATTQGPAPSEPPQDQVSGETGQGGSVAEGGADNERNSSQGGGRSL